MHNVTPSPRPRILAVGYATDKRLETPTECAVIPAAERALHASLTRAVASRHQRAAVRAEQEAA